MPCRRNRHDEQVFEVEPAPRQEGREVMEVQRKAHCLRVFPAQYALDHRPFAEQFLVQLRFGTADQVSELLVLRERADQLENPRHIARPRGFDAEVHEKNSTLEGGGPGRAQPLLRLIVRQGLASLACGK
jgi:hypothetical protein